MDKGLLQWHPAFYGAAELEFRANKNDLEFEREYNLSKEPLRVDLLIIKKLTDAVIENEIGNIFKKYNIIEYKSPEDGLTIDDYYKVIGYACLYKGVGVFVNQIPAEELTVSFVREAYPRELFAALEKMGLVRREKFPGIYHIEGNVLFPTQVVVTNRLEKNMHRSLRILSKHVKKEDAQEFIKNAAQMMEPGDRHNADAVLQVSVSANQRLYQELRRDLVMCEALRELMKDEIAEEVLKGEARGMIRFSIDLGYSDEEIIFALQKKLNITKEWADKYLADFYEQSH